VIVDELVAGLSEVVPAEVVAVEHGPFIFTLVGQGWNFNAACPWRVTRDGRLSSGTQDDATEADVRSLVGEVLVGAAVRAGSGGPDDPVLIMNGGLRIELFVETHLDPWASRVPAILLVGDGEVRQRGAEERCDGPLISAFAGRLPAPIDRAVYPTGTLQLSGEGWAVTASCPWRLSRQGELIVGWSDDRAADVVGALDERTLQSLALRRGLGGADDPVLILDDGSTLELFADSDDEPWTATVDGQRMVGQGSRSG
jgi:hypothetical protein